MSNGLSCQIYLKAWNRSPPLWSLACVWNTICAISKMLSAACYTPVINLPVAAEGEHLVVSAYKCSSLCWQVFPISVSLVEGSVGLCLSNTIPVNRCWNLEVLNCHFFFFVCKILQQAILKCQRGLIAKQERGSEERWSKGSGAVWWQHLCCLFSDR